VHVSLDHVHIFSSKLSTTIEFFSRMLGATVVWDELAAGTRSVRLVLGRAFIHVYDQPPKRARGGAVHHLGIEMDDLDALIAGMKANGFQFRNTIHEESKFRCVMIAGPDDLLIELFECREPGRWKIE
jgi:catechol 2,3-dioxygenase-like lactoylglutathione lyase family enzyme